MTCVVFTFAAGFLLGAVCEALFGHRLRSAGERAADWVIARIRRSR